MEPLLDGVAETLLWPLRSRAWQSRRPRSGFHDPLSEKLHDTITYDYRRFGRPGPAHAVRAAILDREIRAYLAGHPRATVVALGEGLQTTYWRLGRPDVPWLTVDLPEVQELRARFLPAEPGMTAYAGSALDRAWLDLVDPAHGVFLSAEGLFMYLDPDAVFALIADCAARFPGGALFFDSIPAWLSARPRRLSADYTAPPMPFSLSVSQALALPTRIPGVATATDLKAPASRLLTALADSRVLRDRRPSMTLLNFNPALSCTS
ncbi:class I SAM-dependent methyltransferase [Actinoplanes sp. NPDC051851]|uniref:class I SAM-dependent methyltransferase n=1 Tax=Actinoplanes sp. NPDC051851 TaxID=3154753 RepID=UPI0034139B92